MTDWIDITSDDHWETEDDVTWDGTKWELGEDDGIFNGFTLKAKESGFFGAPRTVSRIRITGRCECVYETQYEPYKCSYRAQLWWGGYDYDQDIDETFVPYLLYAPGAVEVVFDPPVTLENVGPDDFPGSLVFDARGCPEQYDFCCDYPTVYITKIEVLLADSQPIRFWTNYINTREVCND